MKRILIGLAVAAMIMGSCAGADAELYKCYVIKGVSPSGEGVGRMFLANYPSCALLKAVFAPAGSYVQGDNRSCVIDRDGVNVLFCIP